MEGDLKGSQWTNVQDPVKQMITAITKAVRTQSAGIKDLDRRIEDVPTNDVLDARLQDVLRSVMEQVEAQTKPLRDNMKNKASISDLSTLEKNTLSMAKQLDKINELLHSQNNAILNLNDRIGQITNEVQAIKEPLLQKMMNYVDRQTDNLIAEIDRKLALKADQTREADIAATTRHINEEVVPSLMGQIAELRAEMRDVATRADLHVLASSKANVSDLNDLVADIGERPHRAEAQQLVSAQIKPLVSAITAMEKAIHVQEININNSRIEIKKSAAVQGPRAASPPRSLSREQIGDIVDEAFREKAAQNMFVAPGGMETALAQQRETLLEEVHARQNSVREELRADCKEMIASFKRQTDGRLTEIATSAREARDLNGNARGAVKELSSNVAKALARKVDKTDIRRLIKENVITGGKAGFKEESAHVNNDHATPQLLSKSNAQWAHQSTLAHGGPLSASVLSAPAAPPVNEESARNEEMLKQQLELIQDHLFSLKNEMSALQRTVRDKSSSPSRRSGRDKVVHCSEGAASSMSSGEEIRQRPASANAAAPTGNPLEWKLALNELSTNLRREMTDKVGREELLNTVHAEMQLLETKLLSMKKELGGKASLDDLSRVEAETALLRSQVTAELTGARWLWRSGKIMKEGWIPWDTEVANAMPNALVWRSNSPLVLTRPAGLYRLCVSIFTSLPAMVQVCLNGEPIFTLQPERHSDSSLLEEGGVGNPVREDRYILRRNRHSTGEVTCMSIDEYVSLPANAKLAVRFSSQASAQAFFSIKKL